MIMGGFMAGYALGTMMESESSHHVEEAPRRCPIFISLTLVSSDRGRIIIDMNRITYITEESTTSGRGISMVTSKYCTVHVTGIPDISGFNVKESYDDIVKMLSEGW